MDATHPLGLRAGSETHTLTHAELPEHTHPAQATSATATSDDPSGKLLGPVAPGPFSIVPYGDLTNPVALSPLTLVNAGASQPHDNMQPWLALRFCIALQGIFPSPT
jgi:microcystin-dependent protein